MKPSELAGALGKGGWKLISPVLVLNVATGRESPLSVPEVNVSVEYFQKSPIPVSVPTKELAVGAASFVPTGVPGWITGGASPGTLFSLDRNTDPPGRAGTAMGTSQ